MGQKDPKWLQFPLMKISKKFAEPIFLILFSQSQMNIKDEK